MNSAVNHSEISLNGIAPGSWGEASGEVAIASDVVHPALGRSTWGMNIVVIDDRPLLRECFAKGIEAAQEGISVLCFSSVVEWQSVAQQHKAVSVVLLCRSGRKMAVSHPEIEALSAGDVPLILVSDEDDADEIRTAIGLGARGFIPENVELRLAVTAMYLVRAGGVYLPESVLHSARRPGHVGNSNGLSPIQTLFTERQAAVVEALRQGKPNKIIAYELNMRESTVKVHIRNVMAKLKAKNRTEVAFITNRLYRDDVE